MHLNVDLHVRVVLTLLVVLLAGCEQGKSSIPDPYGLTAVIGGTPPAERTWREAKTKEIATVSRGEEYALLNPMGVEVIDANVLAVHDAGDMTVKAFTPEGSHLATYGKGRGRGPGQLMMLTDIDQADSLVHLVDPQQRRGTFFRQSGDFVRGS